MYMSGNDMGKWVKYLLSATNATGRGQSASSVCCDAPRGLRVFAGLHAYACAPWVCLRSCGGVYAALVPARGVTVQGRHVRVRVLYIRRLHQRCVLPRHCTGVRWWRVVNAGMCMRVAGFWATTKGGDVPGYNCAIIVVPELGLGISVLTSSGNFDSSTISVPALNALIPAVQAALESKAAAVRGSAGSHCVTGPDRALHAQNAERVYCGEYVYSAKDLSFLITASPQGLHLASASDPSVTGTLIPSGSANTFFLVPKYVRSGGVTYCCC